MPICEYGCGQEAKYKFKNGKWCCSKNHAKCPFIRKKLSGKNNYFYGKHHTPSRKENQSKKLIEAWKDPNSGLNSKSCKEKQSKKLKKARKDPNSNYNSISCKTKQSIKMKELHKDPNSIFNSKSCKENHSNGMKKAWKVLNNNIGNKLTIEKINKKYPFFSKLEEMRYNPDKPEEKEIQVHCKNHNCKNSKEKGGWFTPIYIQISERIRAIETPYKMTENNFYCSQYCKDTCFLFGLRSDPFKENNLPYTAAEKEVWRQVVLEREKGLCEYCGEPAEHVHHIFSVKLEPFFALDPDYGVACCAKHHYKYGHKDECSTGNLAKIVCSVESQKFLNQVLEDI